MKANDDPRVGDLIKPRSGKRADAVILGLPFDLGVKNSGGRIGASGAPTFIRKSLARYGTAYNLERKADISKISIEDFGDVKVINNSVEKTHKNVFDAALGAFKSSSAVITIGGGNDLSYATVKALSRSGGKITGGINIDAHFDVRPVSGGLISSGTPYRRLLEENILSADNFSEFAAQGHVNAKSHYDWLSKKGTNICFLSEARKNGVVKTFGKILGSLKMPDELFVSLDIDSIAQAFAPGSSAPSPDGLLPAEILEMAYIAGKNPKVRLFEIMEVNPKYDQDNRTSRLAANIIGEFLAGFSNRK